MLEGSTSLGSKIAPHSVKVVIAAYNAATFIDRAINSIVETSALSVEILVIDDCSGDGTADVVRGIAKTDPRIKVTSLAQNSGPSAARNRGIELASGDWIAVLDADDAFEAGRLGKLIDIALAEGADAIADNFLPFDAATGAVGNPGLNPGSGTEFISLHTFIDRAQPFTNEADWGLLKPIFRRAFLNSHGLRYPENSRHGEDFLLIVEFIAVGGKYILTRDPGYIWAPPFTARQTGFVMIHWRCGAGANDAAIGAFRVIGPHEASVGGRRSAGGAGAGCGFRGIPADAGIGAGLFGRCQGRSATV